MPKAAKDGDVATLRRELAKGVSPNVLDRKGWTPLQCLCYQGNNPEARVDCVHVLLEAGADIHAHDRSGSQSTPLHIAADCGPAKVVAALLEAGADVNRGNAFGETPLHLACWRNDSDVEPAQLVIRNGATVNARDSRGRTPLHYARYKSHSRLVPILLRAGATPPAQTINAHIQEVIAAGGFGRYESNHLNALAATFAPHFAHLPPEIVRLVVEYAFHVGEY